MSWLAQSATEAPCLLGGTPRRDASLARSIKTGRSARKLLERLIHPTLLPLEGGEGGQKYLVYGGRQVEQPGFGQTVNDGDKTLWKREKIITTLDYNKKSVLEKYSFAQLITHDLSSLRI